MKAGKTDLEVGTLVRVTHISDLDDQEFVGVEGTITHPFPGLMHGSSDKYVAGIDVTEESAREHGIGPGRLGITRINLMSGDRFVVIEPSDDLDADASGPKP